jgi:hypothetical protein
MINIDLIRDQIRDELLKSGIQYCKLECHGTYDKATVDAILKLMGID